MFFHEALDLAGVSPGDCKGERVPFGTGDEGWRGNHGQKIRRIMENSYSDRRLFMGLASAAPTAWKLTVSRAIKTAAPPARTKTHHWMLIRSAKFPSHLSRPNHAIGVAINTARRTSRMK